MARAEKQGETEVGRSARQPPGPPPCWVFFSVREAGGMGCVSLESDYELNTS